MNAHQAPDREIVAKAENSGARAKRQGGGAQLESAVAPPGRE